MYMSAPHPNFLRSLNYNQFASNQLYCKLIKNYVAHFAHL